MRIFSESFKHSAVEWLRQGISPRRLALTIALGFAIGCIPVVGVPTVLCAALALALRLNLPAIQAANYAAMPLQLILILPFVRLGRWLIAHGAGTSFAAGPLLSATLLGKCLRLGWLMGEALFAWMVVAGPAVLLITVGLTVMLRRIPAIAAAEAGD